MIVLESNPSTDVTYVPIKVAKGGDFKIGLRTPTYDELMIDHGYGLSAVYQRSDSAEVQAKSARHRLECVVDWKGVKTETDVDVPFSHAALGDMFTQNRDVFYEVMRVVNRVYGGLDVESKKSEPTSPEPSKKEKNPATP